MFEMSRSHDDGSFSSEHENVIPFMKKQKPVTTTPKSKPQETNLVNLVFNLSAFIFISLFFCDASFAGAGTAASINNTVNTFVTILKSVAIAVGTGAILWTGFKVVFSGATIREMAPILIGGAIISGASGIGALLFTPD